MATINLKSLIDNFGLREESKSFAVGHLALGYVLGKFSAKVVKTEVVTPLIFMAAVIPDIDIIIQAVFQQFQHRGPTHSIIFAIVVFMPVFALYRKTAVPYFIAFLQHSLIADFVVGGRIQLLWPLTTDYFGIEMCLESPTNIALEWAAFAISMVVLVETKDLVGLFKPHNSNLILIIPTSTVLLPTLLSFPLDVPVLLVAPHVIYLLIFSASIAVDIKVVVKALHRQR